jgi:beta-N-acetylhexosaminidase
MTVIEKITSILSKAPYSLSPEGIEWVAQTMASLTERQKIAQLINVQLLPNDKQMQEEAIQQQVGAVTVLNFASPETCQDVIRRVKSASTIPPLVCADLEGGVTSGNLTSSFPNQLACAAANNIDLYGQSLDVLAKELLSIGVNWTFSPVLDVNQAFQSAIVGTRSYGTNQKLISEMADEHIRIFQKRLIATTAKHWPGEGFDSRDQHLVTTINPLSMDEWQSIFGQLYKRAIETGVTSIMSAHIALPAFAQSKGDTGVDLYKPASISSHLNKTLLRDELNFNGLIISDATLMGGLESWGPRIEWLPALIQNGCDMILFTNSVKTDIDTLVSALNSGALSQVRLDEALIRVLGLKAVVELHRPMELSEFSQVLIDKEMHRAVLSELSDKSITLVKDTQRVLPIDKKTIQKVLIFKEENFNPLGGGEDFCLQLDKLLIAEGFEVHVFDTKNDNLEGYLKYDLIIYALAQESQLTKSRLFLDWAKIHGGTMQGMRRLWWDKPTILISFGHPYYLYDAPRMPCLINAYTPIPAVQAAVVEKLLGRSPFFGQNPIDPFCELPDAIY